MTNEAVTADRVRDEVKNLIAELTEREPAEITDSALFVDDLGVDSLMAIEVMVALDKRYKIDIPEAEFNKIKNVNDAVSVVMQHIAGGNTQSKANVAG
jgi:acyl carrier protein